MDYTLETAQHDCIGLAEAGSQRMRKQPITAEHGPSSEGNLRFFIVDHPAKLKDKAQMRANRKHVMRDYLNKERMNPDSKDARVTGPIGAPRRRKRLHEDSPGKPRQLIVRVDRPLSPNETSVLSIDPGLSDQPIDEMSPTELQLRYQQEHAKRIVIPSRAVRFADDVRPLVRGISGGFNNSPYLATSYEDLPSPGTRLGSNLNPFDTWATFSNQHIDVEELKWSCSRKFGSQGIARLWVPELLKAKHAFLSTVCISSSHDDLMRRGLQAPHERTPYQSADRMRIRSEVITMINDALSDPQLRTADATIVSVLHLLNSEMMGCDDNVMLLHQQGLHDMVKSRGGLNQLGVGGQLASILTITMYMISALRETIPHLDYIKYASQTRTELPDDYRQVPESPIYCRKSGYYTLNRGVVPGGLTWSLLDNLRLITNAFARGCGSTNLTESLQGSASLGQSDGSVSTLRDTIFATKHATDYPDSAFLTVSDKYIFEAIRLTARVYAHALTNKIPFSKAAAELGGWDACSFTVSTSPGSKSDGSSKDNNYAAASWHMLVKAALIRTDLSDCWGHLAGVLYWLTIIAGACANPHSTHNKPRREISPEEEECRQWLAAIAVRCSILLSFEYGGSVLGTLKRLVGIEQMLAKADADRTRLAQTESGMESGVSFDGVNEEEMFGPQEVPFLQRTFHDFATDFMSEV